MSNNLYEGMISLFSFSGNDILRELVLGLSRCREKVFCLIDHLYFLFPNVLYQVFIHCIV